MTTTKTPVIKDETIKELKRLLDEERAKSRQLELELEESRSNNCLELIDSKEIQSTSVFIRACQII